MAGGPVSTRPGPGPALFRLCGAGFAGIMPVMRKWLVLLLALAILYALPKFNTRRSRRSFPLMKRINETVNILAAVLLVVYLVAFVYWLVTR
jgi:hypothetical protein